ncbi:DarT ssDNA thymidine ADP-ribosyltransferase family protein [Lentibacillus sp. CBA3610]|uniref:DarT ssDNA thymidine ADP-ribosyltransferase family protein n=1 Tax=Lentibacillus sp. CBA3610 TaxID=2518176 RepID=UPI001596113A|nr:DarT ssDNA thymidine ADP-ribosyltransferase family protein [Lentibacillus sp. CBA3610]QKY70259.1 DUF4433 domain-containing protein [Lentibacillus sp. CBA3610]
MGLGNIKEKKLLYHLTKLSNIDSIIEKGLTPRKLIKNHEILFQDVADPDIISKRTVLDLQEFVPFHFHPYSAFDTAVKSKYSEEEFVYICIHREKARYNKFKILLKHPLTTEQPKLYDYDEGFELIDWDTMHTMGNETDYKKHVKMAECLTSKVIPAKHFQCIYVKNDNTKQLVEEKLQVHKISARPPYVNIGEWFDT